MSRTMTGELREVLGRVVDEFSFSNLGVHGNAVHGNAGWTPAGLAAVAVVWAWHGLDGLVVRYEQARAVLAKLRPEERPPGTYQGFVKMLAAHSDRLLAVVIATLRQRMRDESAAFWTIGHWPVFAVDGTRLLAPRTAENQAWFDRPAERRSDDHCRRRSRRRRSRRRTLKSNAHEDRPQAWLTVLWHVGLGLPWAFRQGPRGDSETAHLKEMLAELPEGALVTADAGFTGYDLWREILEAGCELLIRVGGNVRLLDAAGHVRRRGEIVLLWPDAACRKQQPPLVLRVVRLTTGRTPMLLVTSVLDHRLLSDRQALAIYRRRWGVEVFIRSFKQTFERGELCSRAPANAERELAWSLVALWGVQLLGASELIAAGFDPATLSTAGALRALRSALAAVRPVPTGGLLASLAIPADDGYRRRNKASRDYPRKRRSRPPTVPHLHRLKHYHITQLKAVTL